MRNGAMKGGRRGFAGAVLLAAVLRASAPAHAEGVDPQLSSRLQRIESAFRGGDAGALRPCFAASGKVRVDLKDLTDGPASYGPGQLQVVFEQIFDGNRTREFAFRKQDVTVPSPGTAFAKGRWVRRTRAGGQETVDTLTFTLREENQDWRIHEILTSR
jgi:Domain of unknown function (DUF4440)